VQKFFQDTPFEQYAVELICFFGMVVYMIVRYIMLGLDIYGEEKRVKHFPLISGIVAGILVTAINGVCDYTQQANIYKEDGISGFIAMLAVTFICATVVTFVVLSCLDYINKKKQVKIQNVLDEEEQDEYK
jgi:cytosine/uracil/thiamine/allantoin permease